MQDNTQPTQPTPEALPPTMLEAPSSSKIPTAKAYKTTEQDRARTKHHQQEKRNQNCVPLEELKLYQDDPLRETHLGITDYVVCRECGWEGQRLYHHVRKLHKLTPDAYSEKWNYPPLVAPNYRLRASEEKKHWHQADPEKRKFFHTKDGENKRHVLVRGEAVHAGANKPATPAQRRAWIEQGQRLAGKPRHDRRGKKLIGSNRQSGTWVDAPPVDDARIAELRLAGKTYREIGDEVDRAGAAVQKITKLCGFPAGVACKFLHGEPLTKRHFLELCKDFGQSKKAVIEAAGLGYASIMSHLWKMEDQDVFSTKVGGAFFDLQRKWTDSHCIKNVAGKEVRELLTSELRNLPALQSRLRTGLQALRAWLRSASKDLQPTEMLNWICAQARLEVAASRTTTEPQREFRTLLFMWPRLKELCQKPGLLAGKRHIDQVANELLGLDYGAATARITQAVAGNLAALHSQTLALVLRTENGATHEATKTGAATDPKPPSENTLRKGQLCDQIIGELRQIKRLCIDGGRGVVEIQYEHPGFAAWALREALGEEDRDTFNHPRQWGPVVGYAYMILGKHYGVHSGSVERWVKAHRRSRRNIPTAEK